MSENDAVLAADALSVGIVTITDDRRRLLADYKNSGVFFSPLAEAVVLPQVWLDLHAANASYQVCGRDRDLQPKKQGDERVIVVPRRSSVRIRTMESIGTDRNHVAILSNIRSLAFGGLLMAPGKIDTGFPPRSLYLVIYNSTNRAQAIRVGQKVAAICFLRAAVAGGTMNVPDAKPNEYVVYMPSMLNRLKAFSETQILPNLGTSILSLIVRGLVIALAVYFGAWLAGRPLPMSPFPALQGPSTGVPSSAKPP